MANIGKYIKKIVSFYTKLSVTLVSIHFEKYQ
jgi:hypothetical protein